MARVRMASEILECGNLSLVNLLDVPTDNVLDIANFAGGDEIWEESRSKIKQAAESADIALFAWGVSVPTGPSRRLYQEQVASVTALVSSAGLAAWVVGDGARHPSRWQRYTSKHFPGLPFREALMKSLKLLEKPLCQA